MNVATILIIDDDAFVRETVDVLLTQGGYTVACAASARSGLSMLRTMRIDLVLLDIHMPEMDGLATLSTIRRTIRPAPPILMLTSDRRPEPVAEARARGCAGYIAKPFTPDGLSERVKMALRRTSTSRGGDGTVETATADPGAWILD